MIDVVLDTNVLVAALRSNAGASFRLVQLLPTRAYRPNVTPALCLEYEEVLFRPALLPGYPRQMLDLFLNQLLAASGKRRVHFRWRPHLPDPGDDLVMEAALAAGAAYIVTHNLRHFNAASSMGVVAVTPDKFLAMLHAP